MKKFIAVLTICFITLGFLGDVNALTIDESRHDVVITENVITPRAAMCQCGGTLNVVRSYATTWVRTGEVRTCQHYPWGQDLKESRQVTKTYKCSRCGVGHTSNYDEYRWDCKGHI